MKINKTALWKIQDSTGLSFRMFPSQKHLKRDTWAPCQRKPWVWWAGSYKWILLKESQESKLSSIHGLTISETQKMMRTFWTWLLQCNVPSTPPSLASPVTVKSFNRISSFFRTSLCNKIPKSTTVQWATRRKRLLASTSSKPKVLPQAHLRCIWLMVQALIWPTRNISKIMTFKATENRTKITSKWINFLWELSDRMMRIVSSLLGMGLGLI